MNEDTIKFYETEPFDDTDDDTIPFNEKTPFERQISDEVAFALSNSLHWLAIACDDKYLGQILRHMKTIDGSDPVDPE